MYGPNADYQGRFDDVFVFGHKCGFRLVNVLTLDFTGTGPYQLNNKVTVSYEVISHLAPAIQFQTISGSPSPVWRWGLEGRF